MINVFAVIEHWQPHINRIGFIATRTIHYNHSGWVVVTGTKNRHFRARIVIHRRTHHHIDDRLNLDANNTRESTTTTTTSDTPKKKKKKNGNKTEESSREEKKVLLQINNTFLFTTAVMTMTTMMTMMTTTTTTMTTKAIADCYIDMRFPQFSCRDESPDGLNLNGILSIVSAKSSRVCRSKGWCVGAPSIPNRFDPLWLVRVSCGCDSESRLGPSQPSKSLGECHTIAIMAVWSERAWNADENGNSSEKNWPNHIYRLIITAITSHDADCTDDNNWFRRCCCHSIGGFHVAANNVDSGQLTLKGELTIDITNPSSKFDKFQRKNAIRILEFCATCMSNPQCHARQFHQNVRFHLITHIPNPQFVSGIDFPTIRFMSLLFSLLSAIRRIHVCLIDNCLLSGSPLLPLTSSLSLALYRAQAPAQASAQAPPPAHMTNKKYSCQTQPSNGPIAACVCNVGKL